MQLISSWLKRTLKDEHWLLTVVFVLSLFSWKLVPPRIQGDGVGYYAYLRSAFFDRDLDFRNEYMHYREVSSAIQFIDEGSLTQTGLVNNVWSVGPAILWSPFFLVGHLAVRMLDSFGYRISIDGYSAPYAVAISLGSSLYAFISLLLVYSICKHYFSKDVSLIALLVIWFSTSLPAYMYFYPSMAHATSFFSVSLFVWGWHMTRGRRTKLGWVVLGLLTGLMTMVRWQNCLFGIVLAIEAVESLACYVGKRNWKGVSVLMVNGLLFLGCAIIAFLPQMLAWQTLYGRFLASPFNPDSPTAGFQWMRYIPKVLFSSKHGLISWTPIVGLALVGLPLFARKDKVFALSLASAFMLQLSLVGSWRSWSQGASFGGRMFVGCTLVFTVGLAALIDWARARIPMRLLGLIGALFVVWNLLFMFQYGVGLVPHEDYISWKQVILNQFLVVPKLLVQIVTAPGTVRLP